MAGKEYGATPFSKLPIDFDTECEVDFGLGMGGEIIKRPFLTGQLAEQDSEYRSDRSGLAGSVFAYDGD